MFQVCMFGAYEGRLAASKRVVLTMFGAAELHRPTLARRLLAKSARANEAKPDRYRPVVITHDGVVIRGQGAEATQIVFRYGPPDGGVALFRPREGETVGQDTLIEIHAAPDGLKRIALQADGETVAEAVRSAHWGGTYLLRTLGSDVVRRTGAGRHELKAVAQWDGDRRAEAAVTVTVDPRLRLPAASPYTAFISV